MVKRILLGIGGAVVLLVLCFFIYAEISGGHIFTFYAICMMAQLIWVMKVMPETRGRSLEQIQKEFGIG